MIVHKNIFLSTMVLAVALGFSKRGMAADIQINNLGEIRISGEIKAGDAEKMALVMTQKLNHPVGLEINSPGGDVGAAMQMATLVKGSHLHVRVSTGGYCVSACFFIFLEGFSRNASWALEDGTLEPKTRRAKFAGVVGIHRPYLKSNYGDVASIKNQEELMKRVRTTLVLKALPEYLIDEMMSRPSNDVYWLTFRDLELIGEYNPGVEEALIARCGYLRPTAWQKLLYTLGSEAFTKKTNELIRCESNYTVDIYHPISKQFIAKLQAGWRPWTQ